MRINCVKCGKMHDSTVTPFLHDIVPETEVDHKEYHDQHGTLEEETWQREGQSEFTCKSCGADNEITFEQYVLESHLEDDDEN